MLCFPFSQDPPPLTDLPALVFLTLCALASDPPDLDVFGATAASTLPFALLAQLAVGRIILARKLSLGGAVVVLEADSFGWWLFGGGLGPKVLLVLCWFGAGGGIPRVLILSADKPAPAAALAPDVRLDAVPLRGSPDEDVKPCLAAEDAVCDTRCAGSFTGRVGDRGRGLTKPVEGW